MAIAFNTHKDNAVTTLSTGIDGVVTTMTVADGTKLPATFPCVLTIFNSDPNVNNEKVLVSNIVGNVVTMTRDYESSGAQTWAADANVRNFLITSEVELIEDTINGIIAGTQQLDALDVAGDSDFGGDVDITGGNLTINRAYATAWLVGSTAADFILQDTGSTDDQEILRIRTEAQKTVFQALDDAYAITYDDIISIDHSNGKVDFGYDATFSGNVLVSPSSSGATPYTHSDTLVVEESDNAGISILAGATSDARLTFGNSADNNVGELRYDLNNDNFSFSSGGVYRMIFSTTNRVQFNNTNADYDFRVDGGTLDSLIFVDASTDSVSFAGDATFSGDVDIDGDLECNGTYLKLPVKTGAGDPSSPADGWMYVNTSLNAVRVYADGAWRDLATW